MKKADKKPTIALTFFTFSKNTIREIGIEFFSQLLNFVPEITPDKVDLGRGWQSIDANNYKEVLKPWPFVDTILFRKKKPFNVEIPIMQGQRLIGPNFLTYYIDDKYFQDPNNTKKFIDVSIEIYKILKPDYGLIHSTDNKINKLTKVDQKYGRTILPIDLQKGLPGIYWANFFNKRYCEIIGKEKLLNSSCYNKIELSDGGILIILSPSPYEQSLEEDKKIEMEWKSYLGNQFFVPI